MFYSRLLSTLHFFFFNDTATTEIYTLSLHDALPIFGQYHAIGIRSKTKITERVIKAASKVSKLSPDRRWSQLDILPVSHSSRSEEHTSELQSRQYLVCRLLLEKKKYR